MNFECHYHYYFRSSNVVTNRLNVVTLPIAPGSQDASRAPCRSSKVKVMAKSMPFFSPAGLRLIEVFSTYRKTKIELR